MQTVDDSMGERHVHNIDDTIPLVARDVSGKANVVVVDAMDFVERVVVEKRVVEICVAIISASMTPTSVSSWTCPASQRRW